MPKSASKSFIKTEHVLSEFSLNINMIFLIWDKLNILVEAGFWKKGSLGNQSLGVRVHIYSNSGRG